MVGQAWLLALVVLPARSHVAIQIGMVAFLALATVWTLPRRIWQVCHNTDSLIFGF